MRDAEQLVELEFIEYNHGWTVTRTMGDLEIQSIRAHPPHYLYTICTLRRMPAATTPADARDFIATIDIHPESPEYGKIVHIALGSEASDALNPDENLEYHHGDLATIDGKSFLIAPSLNYHNSGIDFFSLASSKAPALTNYLSDYATGALLDAAGVSHAARAFHTTHLNRQTGDIIVSYLGDDSGTSPGGFVRISPNLGALKVDPAVNPIVGNIYHILTATGLSTGGTPDDYLYDFTIDDCNNKLVCTSWGPPTSFDAGFNPALPYGTSIRVLKMPQEGSGTPSPNALVPEVSFNTTIYTNDADANGKEGVVPLEVRRTHVPNQEIYFLGITLPGAIDVVYKNTTTGVWEKKIVISPKQLVADCLNTSLISNQTSTSRVVVPSGNVLGAGTLSVPLVTDITLSEDDKYLYVSCWLAGVVLQYDVSDPLNVKLVGGVGNLGGNVTLGAFNTNSYTYAPGKQFAGGPQMLRLDPSGQNLYVTNSLFSSWDDQFYSAGTGSIRDQGGMMIKLKTGAKRGAKAAAMSIDTAFAKGGVVEFSGLRHPNVTGPFTSRAHESHVVGVRH